MPPDQPTITSADPVTGSLSNPKKSMSLKFTSLNISIQYSSQILVKDEKIRPEDAGIINFLVCVLLVCH